MIDGERLLRSYLLQRSEFAAFGIEIVGQTPKDTGPGWVRLTQIDAPKVGVSHLYELYFQLDVYASKDGIEGSQRREAVLFATTIHDALAALNNQNFQSNGAVITGSDPNMGPRRPDTDLKPARERFISTAKVWAHG